jgi:hypothetical protein
MAAFVVFDKFKYNLGLGTLFDMSANTFKAMLFDTGATDPTGTETDPRFAASGTPDFSDGSYEVAETSGNYPAGGSSIGTVSWVEASGTVTWDTGTAALLWSSHASNPLTAEHVVIYNDSNATKECVGFLDLPQTFDMTTGDLTLTWDASGIFTLA